MMKRCYRVLILAICALLISEVGRTESPTQAQCWSDRCKQPTSHTDAILASAPTLPNVQVAANDKSDKDETQDFVIDQFVVRQLYQTVASIRSACENEITRNDKNSAVEQGLRSLIDLATKYEHIDEKPRIRTRIWFATRQKLRTPHARCHRCYPLRSQVRIRPDP